MSILLTTGGAKVLTRPGGGMPRKALASPGVLTAGDIVYQGAFRLPFTWPTVSFRYSMGTLTGRYVGGALRLFVSGHYLSTPQSIFELTYPGVGQVSLTSPSDANLSSLPQATVVRNWGEISDGRTLVYNASSGFIGGLHWDETAQQLWWGYFDLGYDAAQKHDPSIGVSVLNEGTGAVTAYGPWRLTEPSVRQGRGLMPIPSANRAAYGGKSLAISGTIASQNASGPWGQSFHAFAPPALSTPASAVAPGDTGAIAVVSEPILRYTLDHKLPTGDGSRGINCGVGYALSSFSEVDRVHGGVWIRGASKHGLVSVGNMVWPGRGIPNPPHYIYSESSSDCPHGYSLLPYRTGSGNSPGATSMAHYYWIHDPTALANVPGGTATPYGVPAATEGPLRDLSAYLPTTSATINAVGAPWFDEVSQLLFVPLLNEDAVSGGPDAQPLIHVFAVNC